jgi:tRNA1Val (adenine37-N6)-methyltransferase
MSGIFQFKQFFVDQTGCAMKINTDGVLLGALAEAHDPESILDIGTGTGVIALMLAQRFASAQIDAVEIGASAAQTAERNFLNSPFTMRLTLFPSDFQSFFKDHPFKKYDLIISNPPFHLNSLESPEAKRSLAKHTGNEFFEELMESVAKHLTDNGLLWLILPLETAELVKELAGQVGLYLQNVIRIYSFENDIPHREIVVLSLNNVKLSNGKFVIYDEPKVYSAMYKDVLKDFFTIF